MICGMTLTNMQRAWSSMMTFYYEKNYRPSHIMKSNWKKFQEFMASDSFRMRLLYES
jgi:hypothetical protein